MKKALYTLVYVVVAITVFDIIVWVGNHYWRSVGERTMKDADVSRHD